MSAASTVSTDSVYDETPEFVYAVSLLAALEAATGLAGHTTVLPFLGMARAELTDFGQRRPIRYDAAHIDYLGSGLAELDQCFTALLAQSQGLQHSLRTESALRLLRRGAAAVSDGPDGRTTTTSPLAAEGATHHPPTPASRPPSIKKGSV